MFFDRVLSIIFVTLHDIIFSAMNIDNDNPGVGIAVEQINIDDAHINNVADPFGLNILPTRNLVLFPNVTISISLRREISERVAEKAYADLLPVGIVCQRNPENDSPKLSTGMFRYGVLADILKIIELPTGDKTILVRGREPFRILGAGKKGTSISGALVAKVEFLSDVLPEDGDQQFAMLIKNVKEKLSAICSNLSDPLGHMLGNILSTDDDEMFVNVVLTNFPCEIDRKVKLLGERSLYKRALGLLKILLEKEQEMNISLDIMRKVRVDMDEEQRRAFLHQQMVNIQEQLYGDASNDLVDLEERLNKANLPEAAKAAFNKEMNKLRRINPQNPDYSVAYSYLETMLDVPWNAHDILNTDFSTAQDALDSEHYGLDRVKERILEQVAVLMHDPDGKAPILCLVGPPGVGKTSLGQSIAKSLGRSFARVSLGGLHDESEIRGHRRTYIGAMPGRIIDAMRRAKKVNPVIVLDEVDKIGQDYKGDPAAALLEVLDPEQNCHFHDNYLDVDYDLSKVMFIATSNTLSSVPQPLIDRMEVIDISGYLAEEKMEIARRHLLPRIFSDLKIESDAFYIADDALRTIIDRYTNESGVRQLEKMLSKIARKYILALLSKKDFPAEVSPSDLYQFLGMAPYDKETYEDNRFAGVVTGLAWTQTGGEILLVESSLTPGKGDRLTLTGNLGDVMKESATIAMQWVKANAARIGIDKSLFEKYDLHLHFPEGAIPKDGPSAGITIATSIVSSFTQRRVRERLAMTGEITLRGKVLPVGGIKEKILAAKRAGITDIALSADNRKNIDDISAAYVEGLTFHYFDKVIDVIEFAITDQPVDNALIL